MSFRVDLAGEDGVVPFGQKATSGISGRQFFTQALFDQGSDHETIE
jgi:hypothetical protein